MYRLRRQRQQYEKELAVQYERQRISAEMHDDLGAGLSGVRLLTEIARAKMRDDTGRQEMDAIHQSVGELSSRMREVIWSLNTENDTLLSLVTYIQKQVKAMLEHYPTSVKFDITEPLPDLVVHGEARRNIYLCVKEAVHNIMKHARASQVTISIAAGKSLNVAVADNGIGLTEGVQKAGGYGLKNMQNRMAALQGRLTVQSGNGVTITLEIPTDRL
jgi:signal transduction histidine kinase